MEKIKKMYEENYKYIRNFIKQNWLAELVNFQKFSIK